MYQFRVNENDRLQNGRVFSRGDRPQDGHPASAAEGGIRTGSSEQGGGWLREAHRIEAIPPLVSHETVEAGFALLEQHDGVPTTKMRQWIWP